MNICVVIFCHKRSDKFKIILESLSNNAGFEKFNYIVYQDGLSRNDQCYLEEHKNIPVIWENFVNNSKIEISDFIQSKYNIGLRDSIVSGISEVFIKYQAAIILEDDLVLHQDFLKIMTELIIAHKDNKNIGHINAWAPPAVIKSKYDTIIKTNMMFCWGWATWNDRWKEFPDKKNFKRFPLNK